MLDIHKYVITAIGIIYMSIVNRGFTLYISPGQSSAIQGNSRNYRKISLLGANFICKRHHYFLRGVLYRDVGPFVVCPLSEVLLYKHYTMYMWQLQVENEHYSYYIFHNFY